MTDHTTSENERDASGTSPARDGFALPMVILVIAFLTVTIAAAYAATTSELTTNMAQRGESRAYMLAQAGLENFMARRNETNNGVNFCAVCGAPPTTTFESTTVVLPGGYAAVVATQIRTATDTRPAIYFIRSRGVDTLGYVNGSSYKSGVGGTGVRAERIVGQLVYWNVNQVNVLSGWTATNGFDKNGSAGTISGVDACKKPDGITPMKPTVAGIAVPDGDYTGSGNFTPEGSPAISYLGSQDDADKAVKIDWNGIVNGNRIQPDLVFANNTAGQAGWPTTNFTNNPNYYPVIRVNGDFTLPSTGGRGTLIVLGNLTMSGDNLWHGILLVGGTMTSNGNGTVNGATESGLNTLLSWTIPNTNPVQIDSTQLMAARARTTSTLKRDPDNATANGTKTFQYNSCDVAKAAGGLASYSVFSNAWMDNIVTY
jgi:hypothetical protein